MRVEHRETQRMTGCTTQQSIAPSQIGQPFSQQGNVSEKSCVSWREAKIGISQLHSASSQKERSLAIPWLVNVVRFPLACQANKNEGLALLPFAKV